MSSSSLSPNHIRDIVAQVKSGVKSKTEAFNELKSILQTTAKPASPEADLSDESLQASRFSQEDRRVLINKLIEKKRIGRLGMPLSPDTASRHRHSADSEGVIDDRAEEYTIEAERQEARSSNNYGDSFSR